MTMWLGRQEAVAQFRAYLDYVTALDIISDNGLDSDLNDNKEETEELVHLSSHSTHSSLPSLAQTSTPLQPLSKPIILFQHFLHIFID